jgi:hypothetical protein
VKRDPPPDADSFNGTPDKFAYFSANPGQGDDGPEETQPPPQSAPAPAT